MPIKRLTTSQPSNWSKRLNGYFVSFARRVFHWSPAYKEAVSRVEQKTEQGKRYRCETCGDLVERSQKQVDHIEPVVRVGEKWNGDWNDYRDRLFVDSTKLQVLCKSCHSKKTGKENQGRKIWQNKSKKHRASPPA